MIEITDKKSCMGCGSCTEICPVDCIPLFKDEEGFLYPKIDYDVCISCPLCDRVCPITDKLPEDAKVIPFIEKADLPRYIEPLVYASYSKNHDIRVDSTSGGIFSELALKMFNEGGYVGGAVYNHDLSVSHILTNDSEKLIDIRSSKYVLSSTDKLYPDVKERLRNGDQVLVCGAPCQIVGLYAFLKKDYPNLLTCDFVCKGVNSPLVFEKYIKWLEDKYQSKAVKIKAKDKTEGWHKFSMRVEFENGKSYVKNRYKDPFFVGYLQTELFTMPACFSCQFKGVSQKSDITLADFWGIETIDKSMDQDLGTSLVILNSDKGVKYFESISESIVSKQFTMADALPGNTAIYSSEKEGDPELRKEFYRDLEKRSFDFMIKKYFPMPTVMSRLTIQIERLKRLLKALTQMLLAPSSAAKILSKAFPTLSLSKDKGKNIK